MSETHQPDRADAAPAKPKRGRPRKHASWTDENGQSLALRDHPNYNVCRNFRQNAINPPSDLATLMEWADERPEFIGAVKWAERHGSAEHFHLDDRWLNDIAVFTYEMTDEIGHRPTTYHLIWPIDPRRPVGPSNVRWFRRERWGPNGRVGVHESRRKHLAMAEIAEALTLIDQLDRINSDVHETAWGVR